MEESRSVVETSSVPEERGEGVKGEEDDGDYEMEKEEEEEDETTIQEQEKHEEGEEAGKTDHQAEIDELNKESEL